MIQRYYGVIRKVNIIFISLMIHTLTKVLVVRTISIVPKVNDFQLHLSEKNKSESNVKQIE